MKRTVIEGETERGSAGVKLMIVLTIIILAAHAGYNYVPVAYNAASLKSDIDAAILQGMALPGRVSPVDNVRERIQKALIVNQIPTGAMLDVKQAGSAGAVTAHVSYMQPINLLPFGMYKYNYAFDYTATPTGFLLKQ